MADFALLIESARFVLSNWIKTFAASPTYQVAFVVLAAPALIAWLWLPLCHLFCIKIKGRRPGVQTHLPEEVTEHISSLKRQSVVWSTVWTTAASSICEIFAIVLSLGVFQQGIALRDFSTAACAAFFALVAIIFPLVGGMVAGITTSGLWTLAPLRIKRERMRRAAQRAKGCRYGKGKENNGWKGWTGWEFEDKELLELRRGAQNIKNDKRTAWGMLEKNSLEMSFWMRLQERRVPHIYQLVIPTPNGVKKHRRLDFALLNPKTGVPVLGIETDELDHFKGTAPNDDFVREQEIENAVGIQLHRIPEAYWLRGLEPNDQRIKENQKRLLNAALRERNRIIKGM